MRKFALGLTLFALLSPSIVEAKHGWVSSGAEDLKDKNNPWFLKNVTEIKVCMSFDASGFSPSPTKSRQMILAAFDYWKEQFSNRDSSLGIASQSVLISSEECSGSEDIEFRLGYGSLDSEELEYLSNSSTPQSFAGIAIRKEYNPSNMQGRGVIVIASDKGPTRFKFGQNNSEGFWQNDGLLLRTLIHELGHVYGLPHEIHGLMGERYAEEIIRRFREGSSDLRLISNLPAFFERNPKTPLKMLLGEATVFPGPWIPSRLFHIRQSRYRIDFKNLEDPTTRMLTGNVLPEVKGRQLEFPLQVFVPEGQRVFPGLPKGSYLQGPPRIKETILIEFSELKTRATLRIEPNDIEMIFLGERPNHFKFRSGE